MGAVYLFESKSQSWCLGKTEIASDTALSFIQSLSQGIVLFWT